MRGRVWGRGTVGIDSRLFTDERLVMRSLELFSGAGGLALGMEQAGFSTVALIERNTHACSTLRLNRPQWQVLEMDVREIDFASLGPVDVVAGGPPLPAVFHGR